jgi:hypothetical protein
MASCGQRCHHMPRTSPFSIRLSSAEKAELLRRAGKYTVSYFQVQRAKMILLAAEGLTNDEIAARLDSRREVVGRWRKRFFTDRLQGLEEQSRPGRPPDFFPQTSWFRLKPGRANCRPPTICRCLVGVSMISRVKSVKRDWWLQSVEVPSGGGCTKTRSARGITAVGSFRVNPILPKRPDDCWISMLANGPANY